MRRTKVAWVLGTGLALLSSAASASDTGKGETGGKGGKAPVGAAESGTPEAADKPLAREVKARDEETKPWEIGADFETHRMIRQDDGAGISKVFNIFGVGLTYALSEKDTIGVREYFEEWLIADQGETGVRADDVGATYSHVEPLAHGFSFSGTLAINAPTSLAAQKAGMILSPNVSLGLNRRFGQYVNVGLHVGGGYSFDRYRQAQGGAPNTQGRVSGTLGLSVIMPFHEALSTGISASTAYVWLYNNGGNDPNAQFGTTPDPYYTSQPILQSYGGEIYIHYTLPSLAGVKSDFHIALANGDPSLSYTSYLHDGVGDFYLFYRLQEEVYASLSVRY